MLCDACEQRIGRSEREFKHRIFEPTVRQDRGVLPYGPWLGYFCTSLVFRILKQSTDGERLTWLSQHLHAHQLECVDPALNAWKNFLEGRVSTPAPFEIHCLRLGAISSGPVDGLSAYINRFLLRGTFPSIVRGDDEAFVLAKIGPVAVVGFLEKSSRNDWQRTRVGLQGGALGGDIGLPASFWSYLNREATRLHEAQGNLTEEQRAQVQRAYAQAGTRAATSHAHYALNADLRLFGERAF